MSNAAADAGRTTPTRTPWVLRVAAHPAGPWLLVLLAVLEACVFPAPTEALFLALAIARPRRSWWLAALATAGSVAGGLLGYQLGAAFFDRFGQPLLDWYGLTGHLAAMREVYRDNVFLALATSGYTPIPYMLYTIVGGAFDIPLGPFVAGSIVGRGVKYAILGAVTYYLGPAARAFIERHTRWLVAAAAVAIVVAAVLLWT